MKSVSIPESVKTLGGGAFDGCSSLIEVYYSAYDPVAGHSSNFVAEAYENATLYVRAEAVEKCKEIDPWKNFKSIEAYDFSGMKDASVDFDSNLPYEIYNLSGIKVTNSIENAAPGIYIVRQGDSVKKIAVK